MPQDWFKCLRKNRKVAFVFVCNGKAEEVEKIVKLELGWKLRRRVIKEQWLKEWNEQPSAEWDPSVSPWPFTTSWRSGKQKHWNKRIGDMSFLSRKRWNCGEFTYLVPLGCSSGRTKPVRRTKLILHFRQRKSRAFARNRASFLAFELSVAVTRQPQRFLVFSVCIRATRVLN